MNKVLAQWGYKGLRSWSLDVDGSEYTLVRESVDAGGNTEWDQFKFSGGSLLALVDLVGCIEREQVQVSDLDKLQEGIAVWNKHNFPHGVAYQMLLGVAEEVGELCHAHLKQEQGIRGTDQEHQKAKVDAVGDIVIFLANYCNLSGISLKQAVFDTWQEVKKRDWTKKHNNE